MRYRLVSAAISATATAFVSGIVLISRGAIDFVPSLVLVAVLSGLVTLMPDMKDNA